ncbi:tRNA lysidine(34) synthetase TilS [Psychrobacter sp. ANT_H56B]|uniref:tRNA lysidine(34) synthetase TilS n=1 Tax=Psychrobacter sp. ANT_H56B TaxID=2597353 RepID=UPI0011F0F95C|nr:tRNA lysidine(34) synthetase TilS [Psychrobacter sp. ANT_H56B]KAA0927398.1 tRNA lysidine(34) synthetase TilS [Psychrobacter sp. ANT_H56B]
MSSSAILPYPIESIAELPIDDNLAEALVISMSEYGEQLQGRRIWLACSGGRDSLALAALCVQLYGQGKLPFLPQLLHVNHGLQADSAIWAAHVANWAKAQKIPCTILQAHVNGHDEQAARQARYDVMRAQLNQDDVLLLAHHADDQAETVLMRFIQGAGVNGLSGMHPWRVQTQDAHRIILWRPWLTIQRASISAYAQRLKLPYIDDPTNDGGDNVRSGLRRDIMPVLAKYNPNVIDNIARSAQLLSDAQLTVNAQVAKDLQWTEVASLQLSSAQRVLNIDELQKLPLYRQRQLLHYWLGQDEPLPPAKQLVDNVLSLSQRDDHDHQTELFWQGREQSYTIRRYRQQLYRLSSDWLKWLELPLAEQTQSLLINTESNLIGADVHATGRQPVPINLRNDDKFTWQLQILPNEVMRLLESDKDKVAITFAPLHRSTRIQTALASRPQSGKKLYQTLGIPSWMRESLVVVSVTLINKESSENELLENDCPIEQPILLLSHLENWVLDGAKRLTNTVNNSYSIESAISSCLTVPSSF